MTYTKEQIKQLFQSSFNLEKWTDCIINFFKAKEVNRKPVDLEIDKSEGVGYELGYLDTDDNYRIGFFYLKMNSSVDRRKVGLRQLINKYIKIDSDAGIGVFDDGKHWRLSFITDLRDEKTAPKRFTFVFGESDNQYRTAVDRFAELQQKGVNFKNIKDAFSVEALTKQFYNDLFEWYNWALKDDTGVYFPNNPNTPADDREQLDTKLIRLITRLMFVWFIKQKGLVPDALFNPDEVSHWLKDFDPDDMQSSNYYQAILQNLFFATLNRPIKTITYDKDGKEYVERRGFAHLQGQPDVKSLYRYQELFKISEDKILSIFEFIPFINGGLFECLDKNKKQDGVPAYYHDGFSRNSTIVGGHFTKRAFVPNKLFFDENNGLLSILKRYNFTVEENTPSEQQVALDPELLGKVFENLLGVYNPETQETARNQSGSFYTPREIVNYMVDVSLQTYLGNTDEVKAIFADNFVYDDNRKSFYDSIINKLKNIKVFDPACGSGAFPIGMLNRIIEIFERLHADGEKYDLKLQVMENCIYGCDIQTIAAQITKLRFFISLVCDCHKTDNPDENYGIPNLPNLETHFVAANSLIELKKTNELCLFDYDINDLKDKLKKVRHEHFTAKTVYQKTKLRDRDNQLREELAEMLKSDNIIAIDDALQMAAWNPYDQNAKSPFFDPEWMYGITDGFDVVIGNPPYIKEYTFKSAFDKFRENSKYYQGKMDLWYGFACRGLDMLKTGGLLCFIATNNWTTNSGASIIRNKVISDSKIRQMIDFGSYMVFKESASIQTMIMLFERDSKTDNYAFDYRKLTLKDAQKPQALALLDKSQQEALYLNPVIERKNYIDRPLTFSDDGIDVILNKISNNAKYLNDNDLAQGIVFPQDFLNKKSQLVLGKHKVGDGVFGLTNKEKEDLSLPINELALIKPYYTSEQIHRYYTDSKNNLWMIYTDSSFKDGLKMKLYPKIKNHLDEFLPIFTSDNKPYGLHRSRNEWYFKGEKVICQRKCPNIPVFSYSDFDVYVTQTFYSIKTNRFNMKFLTGLFNSKLVEFWLRNRGKMQGDNFQIDKEPLMKIPIKTESSVEKGISVLVDEIISLKESNPNADTSLMEKEIDSLVYALYGLTEEDIEIVEKQ